MNYKNLTQKLSELNFLHDAYVKSIKIDQVKYTIFEISLFLRLDSKKNKEIIFKDVVEFDLFYPEARSTEIFKVALEYNGEFYSFYLDSDHRDNHYIKCKDMDIVELN